MNYGLHTPNFGTFGDPRTLATLARDAEEAGWDGFFIWDQLIWTQPVNQVLADPEIALAAMATTTSRIKLGTLVTPLARRRPWKLARELVSLDHLSGGRMVLGVGLGEDDFREYSAFGEPADYVTHAEKLDEGLAVLAGLWSGEAFSYEGKHYRVTNVQFLPTPLQQPRIPVWVGGGWPRKRPFRRAANWDGIVPQGIYGALTPGNIREIKSYIKEYRTADAPFDIVYIGTLPGDRSQAEETVSEYQDAGVTWWLENLEPLFSSPVEQVRERLRRGPRG
jgi:alkanesulfonate monooxygenase SsuD/methylene tetrahydromethanopterin reductase-like flavin-dependent oxidoreductase (luciferase family)